MNVLKNNSVRDPLPRFWPGVLTSLVLFFGILFGGLTPPFQAADEFSHYYRALQISQGGWISTRNGSQTGGYVPNAVIEESKKFDRLASHPNQKMTTTEMKEIYHRSRAAGADIWNHRSFVWFSNTALYSPLSYLPQALAIFLGRTAQLSSLGIFYLARCLNLVFAGVLLYFTFRLVRSDLRVMLLLFLTFCTPMAVFEMASVSADATTNAISCATIGLAIALANRWSPALFYGLLTASGAVALCKNVYFPIGFLGFVSIFRWSETRVCLMKRSLLLLGAVFLPLLAWALLVRHIYTPARSDFLVDPKRQLQFVTAHPLRTARLLISTALTEGSSYFDEFTGIFGWMDSKLPDHFFRDYSRLLWILPWMGVFPLAGSKFPRSIAEGLFYECIALFITLMIFLAMYLTWNPVGSSSCDGVQGRYFIPIAGLILISLPTWVRLPRRSYELFVMPMGVTFWITLMVGSLGVLRDRYWN